MKRYRIYKPTRAEIEFARFLSESDITNKYTVDERSRVYGFLVEIAFFNLYGDQFKWVGIYDEYRWDFINYKSGLTVDCKGKPVKRFPPPLNYHCGLFEIKNKAWAKCDIYAFGAVTIDLTKDVQVALVGWERCQGYLQTAVKHPKGSQPPGFDRPLKYPCYEKEYRDLRVFNGNTNT